MQMPLSYSFKVRNKKEVRGTVRSEEEFYQAIEKALEAYETEDIEIALRRIGKGVCPRSFPTSRQSYYFMDIYYKTHGGDNATDLARLPNAGGVLDQPHIFFSASDVISSQRAKFLRKKLDANKDKVHREPNISERSFRGKE